MLCDSSKTLLTYPACTRNIVSERLRGLGLIELRLPLEASKNEKHIPILVSEDLARKKHVIVFFPDRHNDPGILAYRVAGQEGINKGSLVDMIKAIVSHSSSVPDGVSEIGDQQWEAPGIVIANSSQNIWYRADGRAVSDREWHNLPRPSAVHEAMRIDPVKNKIEGLRDFREHVRYIFEHVLSSDDNRKPVCHPEAKFSFIGQEYVGSEAMQYIAKNWFGWRDRVSCMCLINPQHSLEELFSSFDAKAVGDIAEKEQVTGFIAKRTRAYRLSQRPLEAILTGRNRFGCNVYAAGETLYEESCLIRCWPSVLDWIEMCRVSDTFEEPSFEIELSDDEEAQPKIRSPKRNGAAITEEEIKARFHGSLTLSEDGAIAEIK